MVFICFRLNLSKGSTFSFTSKLLVKYFYIPVVFHKVLLHLDMDTNKQNNLVLNFKVSQHFKDHIVNAAKRKGLKPGTFIKAVIKKHTKYKEPELV